jgi:adenine-specific DNA-methyltransferase
MPTLTWLGKEEAVHAARKVPFRLLEHDPTLSYGDPDTSNMLIQGDNLEALKALLPFYAGQVKCIYIDPPYNTGSAFEHYDDNLEHSMWLSLMYPRLELLRELLSEDGLILVSIDDYEQTYLRAICDEIIGRKNWVETFIWQKSYGGGAKSKFTVGLHEYIMCYAKNIENLHPLFLPPDEGVLKYYKLKDDKFKERGPHRLQPLATTSMDERVNLRYPITAPDGSIVWPAKQWQWSQERVIKAIENDEIVFTKSKNGYTLNYKQYLKDENGEVRKTKPKSIIQGHYTQHGTYESMDLFSLKDKFSFPKPEGLIQTVIEIASNPGDLVLDSFLGSGTTAAVAHKMGRRYIGIELGDHAVTHCAPRLRKVIDGEQGGISKAVGWTGGGGFRFYHLGETVFDETGRIHKGVRFPALAAHIWFTETGSPLGLRTGSPFLGEHHGKGYYLLYNGILGDKSVSGGNVLTRALLAQLPPCEGLKIIYGERSTLSAVRLKELGVIFRQIPYDVKAR